MSKTDYRHEYVCGLPEFEYVGGTLNGTLIRTHVHSMRCERWWNEQRALEIDSLVCKSDKEGAGDE